MINPISDTQDVTIVMIEDDAGHARLIEKNLRRAGIANRLVHLTNGREALDYFFSDDTKSQQQPLLVLLDLNLPEVDGYQVLERLKSDEMMKMVPIIVLTTTSNPKEVERCYALGCNVYITKPVEYEAFAESIRKLGLLLSVVKLPQAD